MVESREEDWRRITAGEFTYVPFYVYKKGRTGNYEQFGAFVIGEEDSTIKDQLSRIGIQVSLSK